ncbi:hypothetical protein CH372_19280 [Leptospira meyeri]|nr:hypothetical protein CH372_19280 [Leptospira meyeri]
MYYAPTTPEHKKKPHIFRRKASLFFYSSSTIYDKGSIFPDEGKPAETQQNAFPSPARLGVLAQTRELRTPCSASDGNTFCKGNLRLKKKILKIKKAPNFYSELLPTFVYDM